jgi:hypothetical protein
MKVKASELIGPALDWAVATCEGRDMYFEPADDDPNAYWFRDYETHPDGYVTDYGCWGVCGPIIEREKISISEPIKAANFWSAIRRKDKYGCFEGRGPTPLIAAMRCYVASKLGDEVDVPEGLM